MVNRCRSRRNIPLRGHSLRLRGLRSRGVLQRGTPVTILNMAIEPFLCLPSFLLIIPLELFRFHELMLRIPRSTKVLVVLENGLKLELIPGLSFFVSSNYWLCRSPNDSCCRRASQFPGLFDVRAFGLLGFRCSHRRRYCRVAHCLRLEFPTFLIFQILLFLSLIWFWGRNSPLWHRTKSMPLRRKSKLRIRRNL